MTIQQCRYVIEIACSGSFNEASKNLFITQASLSIAIKELETELDIQIFRRSNKGVSLTKEGIEFIKYARQIVSQVDVVKERYNTNNKSSKYLSISTQHYDFVAQAFVNFMQTHEDGNYSFSLKETKTNEIIYDVQYLISDLGILAFNTSDDKIMRKVFSQNRVVFHSLFETKPFVFIGHNHPLSSNKIISKEELLDYPYIAYEQGQHNPIQFTEELTEDYKYNKTIEINDRATLLNLLLETTSYTIGTGIMTSQLNNGKIVSIPMDDESEYTIGWIERKDIELSNEAKAFIEILSQLISAIHN